MKIRTGFVSNSSSTSFTFCFKGKDVEDLCKLIYKYKSTFTRSYEGEENYSCTDLDVRESIRDSDVPCLPISKVIKERKGERSRVEAELKIEKNRILTFLRDYREDIEEEIAVLSQAKEKGLNRILKIGFGDNHGEVSGGDVGITMDYSGRSININKDDLVVYTRQNR